MKKTSAIRARNKSSKEELALQEIIQQASDKTTRDSFVNYQHKLGVGSDSPLSTATYGFNPITRQRTLLEWMYRGSWIDRKSTRLNSSHIPLSRMPSSA